MKDFIQIERIENKIYLIRGHKVMLDNDLAGLYGVATKRLKEQVKRNMDRFPGDFMFQLTNEEVDSLRSQIATLETKGKGRGRYSKYLPYAFTEHGIAMLSSVLNSKRAVQVNILIIRTFIRLRKIMASHRWLADKIAELEKKYDKHEVEISAIFKVLKKLLAVEQKPKQRIGFRVS